MTRYEILLAIGEAAEKAKGTREDWNAMRGRRYDLCVAEDAAEQAYREASSELDGLVRQLVAAPRAIE